MVTNGLRVLRAGGEATTVVHGNGANTRLMAASFTIGQAQHGLIVVLQILLIITVHRSYPLHVELLVVMGPDGAANRFRFRFIFLLLLLFFFHPDDL